jgi:hypothetical protein
MLHTLNSLLGPISARISVTCYLSNVETADSFDWHSLTAMTLSENWRLPTQPRESLMNVKNKM